MSDNDLKSAAKTIKDAAKDAVKADAKTSTKAAGKELKKLIKDLSPEQRDELLRRMKERKQEGRAPQLTRRAAGDSVPLSFAQEREWFRDRMFPGVAHNISGALRLEGSLSLEALTATFDAIVRRHESLRANISDADGRATAMIRDAAPMPIELVDLAHLGSSEREAAWTQRFDEEVSRGFDLTRDLLLRATLLRLAERDHVLLVTMHHIASDGWSVGVLMNEIAELYRSAVERRSAALPELAVQYGDFARWQRERAALGGLDTSYWRTQLADLPPLLELEPDLLMHDSLGDAARDHEGASTSTSIDRTLREQLDTLSRAEDTTLFVTLLTAFLALMMRCTGRQDLLIGTPVSGRTRVETEPLIGLFLNTVAVRARLSPEMSFREAMAAVRTTMLDALAHADVPIERVIQDLDLGRSANVHPLYETIFNFTPSAPRRIELPGLTATLLDPPVRIEEFSTQLFVTDWDRSLQLDLRYRAQRYSEAKMTFFLEQYVAILQQAAALPDVALESLDLVTPSSRAVLADPTLPLAKPAHATAMECIAAWIARTPDAPALCRGDATLTYRELGARIDARVSALRAGGMERGDVVVVEGPRGFEVIVDMCAAFAAGGVLLTLSSDLPAERRKVMREEAGTHIAAEDAAYVFFTSGSTGKPKGVIGTHQGLAHWLAWEREALGVGPGDRCGQLTGLSFDVVLRDVFLPLTSGATLVLPPDDALATGDATLRWLDRERIALIHTVPAVVASWLLDIPAGVTLASLRRIVFAGEPLTSAMVSAWRNAFPAAGEIVNVYGPTETTLAKFFYRVPARVRAGIQPVGQALPNTQALVLTPRQTQCGVGELGEIAIRTPFRTHGYVNAPEENRTRFVRNPFRDSADDLLYRTGDRGVIGADGLLEFRGRIDEQVKIRGVRVEPAEVAATLQSAPGVAACAVIVRDDGEEDAAPQLVAYVVLRRGESESAERLREHLAQRLPPAMVPSAFVFLDALPLTANQKVDRQRLPAPSRVRAAESRYVAPRDPIELGLVQVWESVLNVRPIGVTDRFFDLGGHSLLALRLLVEVERQMGRKVPLPALFEEPTIEHLAAVLRRDAGEWPLLVKLRAAQSPHRLFLVHPGGGTLLNYVHLLRHLPPALSVYGIQARGLDGNGEPHESIEQMAADYLAEMRRVQPSGPYLLAGHSLGGVIAFEMARGLREQDETVAFLGMFDSVAPLPGRDAEPVDERREDAVRLATMIEAIGRFMGKTIPLSERELAGLSSDDQIDLVVSRLRSSHVFPPGDEQKLLRNLLRVGKAHVRAHRAYRAAPAAVPITLFRASEAQRSDYPSASDAVLAHESLGWQHLTTERVRILHTGGNHVSMMSAAHAEEVARLLEPCLRDAIG